MFGIHPNGFAGHMARSPEVTRTSPAAAAAFAEQYLGTASSY